MVWFGRGPFRFGRLALIVPTLGLAASLPAGGVSAQVAPANSAAPVNTTAPADTVGPRELRNFSLGDTASPTNQSAPTDVVTRPSSSVIPPAPQPRPASPVSVAPAPVEIPTARPIAPRAETPRAAPTTRPTSGAVTVPLPPAGSLLGTATPANENNLPDTGPPVAVPSQPAMPSAAAPDNSSSLPWLLGLAALALAGVAFAFRQRLGFGRVAEPVLSTGRVFMPEPMSPPPPAPRAMPSPPAPRTPVAPPTAPPPQNRPLGIVSTRLRPWLEIAFEPSLAVVDEKNTSVQFDVVITNSGSAPARQVLVEACMINAAPDQDVELRRFFEAPVGAGDRVETIPPLGSVALKSAVSLPLDQVRAYEVAGRKLFVPVVAFNALYEWGGGKGQSSASFIVGRGANGGEPENDGSARMAPLRLDLGPRLFRDLDSRRHPLGLRV